MAFTAEDLFNSIDTIVGQRLSALSFDTTVIATIVDDSKKAQGHYVVSDGSIKFDAYTNDTNYKVDDQVRVTVLNGDWSQKKFIAGKYVDDEVNMEPIHYTPPLGTTMGVGSTPLGTKNYWDLTTNDRSLMQTDPVTIHIDADDTTLQVEGIYNVITLSTEVKTNMGAIGSVASGNYGILVEFVMQPAQGTTIKRFFTFDSSEMVGNPYAFVLDTHQEKKIVVPTIGHVIAINISAYQGLTYDDKGFAHPAPFVDKSGVEIGPHDITFSQTTIGFGSDLTMVEDNSLKLYTLDSATYQWNNGDGKNNTKRLGFVWYNKDDNDEYVGYSDGICDPGYDEIDYLRTKTLDSRLVAQQGKEVPNDEESLRLAANIAEAEPLMRKAYQALTTSVSQVLQRLDNQLVGATEIQEELAKLINGYTESQIFYEAKLSAAFTNAKNATDELVAFYKGVLKYGYHMSTQTTAEDDSDVWQDKWDDADPYTAFLNVFTAIKEDIAGFFIFMEKKTAKGEVLSGYRPFYNDYKPKINTQLAIIDSYLDQIPITSEDATLLHGYKNKIEYKKYDQGEEYWEQFANRYCVYWYRYNPHYLSTHTVPISKDEWEALATKPTSHDTYEAYESYIEQQNIEHKYGDFLGSYWERIRQNGTQVLQNYGVPHDTDGDGTPDITKGEDLPASSDNPIILERTLDPTTDSESYQIVMFYNHEMIKSNVVTFTNTEAHLIPPEAKTDGGDKLLIEHDVDSRDHYQAYSSAYDLLNIRDGSLYRQIKCTYDGVLAGNEAMADAEIYWYVPVNSTMITYDLAFLKNKGFNTDAELEAPTSYSKDGYIYFNRKIGYTEKMEDLLDSDGNPIYKDDGTKQQKSVVEITDADRYFFYKIKNFYEPSAQNNTVLVDVYVPNKVEPTKGELTLTFGTFGTNGTKYTLAVVPAGTQTSLQPHDGDYSGDLELKITLYNAEGEPQDISPSYENEFYSLSTEWYTKSMAAPELGSLTQLMTAESDPDAEQQTPQSSKSWLLSVPGTTGDNYDENCYIGVVKVSTTFKGGPADNPNEIELSSLYAVPFSSSEDLYMSGPTTIVYNSQGTISRMSEEPYKLYQHKLVNRYLINHRLDNDIYAAFKASGEDNYEEYLRTQYPDATIELSYVDSYDEEVVGQKWQLLYYQSDGTNLDPVKGVTADPDNLISEFIPSYLDYMPTLNPDNTLRPAPMYYDYQGAADEEYIFYIPVAQCMDENGNILWTQPIIIIQNRYESAMLNAWDGSLQIDEANGTIMSTMMGAGIKNRDNTFSGVLMGDIVTGADFDTENVRNNKAIPPQNATGIGLYGFHEGAQSFNFNIDGTAFLGKSGHGRLMFDGNHGFLYSANWFESFYAKNEDGSYKTDDTQPTRYGYKNVFLFDGKRRPFIDDVDENGEKTGLKRLGVGRAGMAIDLQRGHMDAYDFKLTGSRIHFNSHPENIGFGLTEDDKNGHELVGYFMRIGNDGITRVDPAELAIDDDEYLLRKTPGLIAMDAEGNLTIRVNSLYLTGNMGGTNLLRQTAPKKIVPIIQQELADGTLLYEKTDEDGNSFIEYTWALDKWDYTGHYEGTPTADKVSLTAELQGMENDESLLGRNYGLKVYNNDYTISQTVTNISGKQDYTISGYVAGLDGTGTLTISIPGTTKSVHAITSQDKEFDPTQISYDKTAWTKFVYTFTTDEDITSLTVSFIGTNNYALWHLMLENGGTASDWSAAPDDIEENAKNEQLNYDTYLTQDEIFKKLTTDPVNGEKMVGIWLLPGEDTASGHKELYINATYMSTGILRSSNWNGTIGLIDKVERDDEGNVVKNEDGTDKIATDAYGNPLKTYTVTKFPTQGVYFNLNEGKIWAAKFELNAWDEDQGLYINSHPNDADAQQPYYFNFGNATNNISFDKNGNFNLIANKFKLEAGEKSRDTDGFIGLYYQHPETDFSVGTGTVEGVNQLTSKNWRIIAGNAFGVTKEGKMIASNAIISGTIRAELGAIGGWTIDSTGIYKISSSVGSVAAGMYSTPYDIDHSIAGVDDKWVFLAGEMVEDQGGGYPREQYHFGVTKNGHLAADQVTISGYIAATGGTIGALNLLSTSVTSLPSLVTSGTTSPILTINNSTEATRNDVYETTFVPPRKGETMKVVGTVYAPGATSVYFYYQDQGVVEEGLTIDNFTSDGATFTIYIGQTIQKDYGISSKLKLPYSYTTSVAGFAMGADGSTYIEHLSVNNLYCSALDGVDNLATTITNLSTTVNSVQSTANAANTKATSANTILNKGSGITGSIKVETPMKYQNNTYTYEYLTISFENGIITGITGQQGGIGGVDQLYPPT